MESYLGRYVKMRNARIPCSRETRAGKSEKKEKPPPPPARKRAGLTTTRGACFTRPTLAAGERVAAERLVAELPTDRVVNPAAVEVVAKLAQNFPIIEWHLQGRCLRCGSSDHWTSKCPLCQHGPPTTAAKEARIRADEMALGMPAQKLRKQCGNATGWGGARPGAGRPYIGGRQTKKPSGAQRRKAAAKRQLFLAQRRGR